MAFGRAGKALDIEDRARVAPAAWAARRSEVGRQRAHDVQPATRFRIPSRNRGILRSTTASRA